MPTKRDEIFFKAGEDFIGTMELARNAIGICRYSWEVRKPDRTVDDEDGFWEYRAAAAVWLNIASDRIRDYFVMARFGMTSKDYKTLHKSNGIYARPFRMHPAGEGESAREAAFDLVSVAERLGRFRKTRNHIVHDIASRQGTNAVTSLNHQRKEAAQSPFVPRSLGEVMVDWNTRSEGINAIVQEREDALRGALDELREWYLLLVRAASVVFEYEYWKRLGR
jgi:hypothetical protein